MTESQRHLIVAIDGPAGSGKSTVARRVASELGFTHLNSGALYRGATLLALRNGVELDDEAAISKMALDSEMRFAAEGSLLLDGENVHAEIYSTRVADSVARVAALPAVRRAITAHQRRIAADCNIVIEGRDVTTVVFPNAQAKFYLDASVEERARRRHAELKQAGESVSLSEIERSIHERDERDKTREDSPLLVADDATVVDSTPLTIEQVVAAIVSTAKAAIERNNVGIIMG